LVSTPSGYRPIEDLAIEDAVYAYDVNGRAVVVSYVRQLMKHVVTEVHTLSINDETIRVTAEHPFYVVGKGSTKVADLKIGHDLLSKEGMQTRIDAIAREERRVCVYNLSVDGQHNYFVGRNAVLVHNKPP